VPRAYDIFRAYEGMKGRKNINKEIKINNNNNPRRYSSDEP
jgi:hypothetical protein